MPFHYLNLTKKRLVLTSDSLSKIKEIIDLLKEIKVVTDQLETENDVSITHIIPNFKFLRDSILTHYDRDSQMIRDMKTHMKIKLDSRYSPFQTEYLTWCSYLDPRFKSHLNFNMADFKKS